MGGKKKKKSKETETPLFEGNPEFVSIGAFFHRWCQRQNVVPKFDLNFSGKPPKLLFSYDLSVETIPFTGHGEAYKKKEAHSKAIINFLPHLIEMGLLKPEECPRIEEESEEEIKRNGSWTEENSKYRLNRFFYVNKLNSTVDFKPADTTSERNLGLHCEMSVYIPHIDKTIVGTGKASSKSIASRKSAKNFIRQLYHLDLVEAFSEAEKKPMRPPSNSAPELSINLPPHLEAEIDSTLKLFGIKPINLVTTVGEEESSPISLMTDIKLEEILPSVACRASFDKTFPLKWSPPEMNFNPWTNAIIKEGPFCNLSLDKISLKLKQEFKESVKNAPAKDRESCIVYPYRQHILDVISSNSIVIIKGNPGCDQTSQVCHYILDQCIESDHGAYCNIIVAHPTFGGLSGLPQNVAAQRGEELGQSVGQFRKFGNICPRPFGSIMFVPFNLLLRKMEFGLKGISHIIFDEFHLRDMFGDMLLIILKYLTKLYPALRIIITTPPVNTTKLVNYFEKPPPVIEIAEKNFPVEEWFLEDFIERSNFKFKEETMKRDPHHAWNENKDEGDEDDDISEEEDDVKMDGENLNKLKKDSKDFNDLSSDLCYSQSTKETMLDLASKKYLFSTMLGILEFIDQLDRPGDVLVIFSGRSLVLAFKRFLDSQHYGFFSRCAFATIYEGQARHVREKALQADPSDRRKIILTTGNASSSALLKNLVFLVDSCREKHIRFGETPGFHLTPGWTAKDKLNLRKIRVSKTSPGNIFYLCSKAQYDSFDDEISPQISNHKIHELVILIKLLCLGSPTSFLSEALDPPPENAIEKAFEWLKFLKFIDNDFELTLYGRILGRLPIDARGSRTILLGCVFSCGDAALSIAASQNISSGLFYQHKTMRSLKNSFAGCYISDQIAVVNAFSKWEQAKEEGDEVVRKFCYINRINLRAAYSILGVKNYLKGILISSGLSEDHFTKKEYNIQGSDPNLIALIGVLAFGLYPNTAYYSSSRYNYPNKLTVENSHPAEFDYYSIASAFLNETFPSSLFIYGQQRKKKFQMCKNMTRITPVHLCILGNGKVEFFNSIVKMDDWLTIHTDPQLIAKLVAIRPIIFFLLDALMRTPSLVHQQEKFNKSLKCIKEIFAYTYEEEMQNSPITLAQSLQNSPLPPAKRMKIEQMD